VQLLKNFPGFYGSWRFITVFTRALHWSLFWARWMQSIPPHHFSLRSVLMLCSHLRQGLPSGVFHSGFPTIFFNSSRWGETVHSVRRPLVSLLYQPGMINEYGAFGGMRIGRRNRSNRIKPAPVLLYPPQIPHDLTWDRTLADAVGSWRLSAWGMAQPFLSCLKWQNYFMYLCCVEGGGQWNLSKNGQCFQLRFMHLNYILIFENCK
jgi:hypothetical protein